MRHVELDLDSTAACRVPRRDSFRPLPDSFSVSSGGQGSKRKSRAELLLGDGVDTSNCKMSGNFSIGNHHLSGTILHSFLHFQ